MLIKRAVLDGIVAGNLDLAFRRWKRPTVRAGGTLTTAVGLLEVRSVEKVSLRSITAAQARRAGYGSRVALAADLDRRTEGDVYRIELRYGGDDPRIALRNATELSTADVEDVLGRLQRLDDRSRRGPWTRTVLEVVAANPHVRAPDLAEGLDLDTPTFKADVRKLKTLGLTISHSPGYELSPRGQVVLDAWRLRSERGNVKRQ